MARTSNRSSRSPESRSFLTFVAVTADGTGRTVGFRNDGTMVKANGNPVSRDLARAMLAGLMDGTVVPITLHAASSGARRHGIGLPDDWTFRGIGELRAVKEALTFRQFVFANAAAKGRKVSEARSLYATIIKSAS